MNNYYKILLTILTISIPVYFTIKHVQNIMLTTKENQKRLISGMLYILLVALIIDIILGIVVFIWSHHYL